MHIAVFAKAFPVLSETFVINQIIGLIKEDVEVDILTNEVVMDNVMHSSVEEYGLMRKVICFGSSNKKNKFLRLLSVVAMSFGLIFKGKISCLIDVFFDKYLLLYQKKDLISALNKNEILKYDNIICHFGTNGYYLCKLRDLGLISGKISTVFHGFEISRYDCVDKYLPQYKQLFLKGDLMLPISKLWKEQLVKWGCPDSKVKVHQMGVDINDFDMRPLNSKLSKPLKVIQVGRLTEKKAILDSINAVALTAKKTPISFTIIGDGELLLPARKLINSLEASEYIFLLGAKPQDIVKQYLEDSDVFLLPSVRAKNGDMEGIPVALMESMSKGLITVSTYHSGIPELIEDKVSGFLVRESKVNELVDCFMEIVNLSDDNIKNIRVEARSTCISKFNNDVLILELTKLF
jgi:colanic acid/amylovoran biosynthesis glycosyltransferase